MSRHFIEDNVRASMIFSFETFWQKLLDTSQTAKDIQTRNYQANKSQKSRVVRFEWSKPEVCRFSLQKIVQIFVEKLDENSKKQRLGNTPRSLKKNVPWRCDIKIYKTLVLDKISIHSCWRNYQAIIDIHLVIDSYHEMFCMKEKLLLKVS